MIHNIRFREFVYESENLDELTQAIYNVFPDAEIESEDAEGLMEDKIIILSGVVDKKRQTKAFFNLFFCTPCIKGRLANKKASGLAACKKQKRHITAHL